MRVIPSLSHRVGSFQWSEPQGFGFFVGRESPRCRLHRRATAIPQPSLEVMKTSEDSAFRYVMTLIKEVPTKVDISLQSKAPFSFHGARSVFQDSGFGRIRNLRPVQFWFLLSRCFPLERESTGFTATLARSTISTSRFFRGA